MKKVINVYFTSLIANPQHSLASTMTIKECASTLIENHKDQLRLIKQEIESRQSIEAQLRLLKREEAYYTERLLALLHKKGKRVDAAQGWLHRRHRVAYILRPTKEPAGKSHHYYCEIERCREL